jgi:hypothetical protein
MGVSMRLKIGDKVVEVEMKNGIPTVQATAEEIHREDGTIDVIVHVPCIQLSAKGN